MLTLFWDNGECSHSSTLPEIQDAVVLPGDSEGSTCASGVNTALEGLRNSIRAIIRDRVLARFCNKIESFNVSMFFGVRNVNESFIVTEDMAAQYVLIQPGLSGDNNTVSFRSCADPMKYLKVDFINNTENLIVEVTIDDKDSPTTQREATFYQRKDIFFAGFDSFESIVFAERFIRHSQTRLRLDDQNSPGSDPDQFMRDASFRILPQTLH